MSLRRVSSNPYADARQPTRRGDRSLSRACRRARTLRSRICARKLRHFDVYADHTRRAAAVRFGLTVVGIQENSTLHDEMRTLLHEFSLLSQARHHM